MLDASLVGGAVPVVLMFAGVVALLALVLGRRDRRWWTHAVPIVGIGTAAVLGLFLVALRVLRPLPDPLPAVVWWSATVAVAGTGLAVVLVRRPGRARRVSVVVAAVVVLLAAGNQVNQHFGQLPTLRVALGLPPTNQVDIGQVSGPIAGTVTRPAGGPLSAAWTPPPDMPTGGTVSQVAIPAPVSRFAARPGWVYLPPAYLSTPRAQLPVLVLVSGQPGSPRDWLDGGRLSQVLDAFAAGHDGLAPVVVIPDILGAPFANPLCLDSRLGRVQTYLTVDVPAWIRATLQVDPDPVTWAIGGYSAGGTCALQLAVNAPQVYPSFVDISGQVELTLGDRARTIQAAFGGDAVAFRAVNALDLLGSRTYPDSAGVVAVGRDDPTYRPQAATVADAARRAGMRIDYLELPGGHDWRVWGPALQSALPWLASRAQLIP